MGGMTMNRRLDFSDNKMWIIICTVAILCGFISFFVTVNLYDANQSKEQEKIALERKEEAPVKVAQKPSPTKQPIARIDEMVAYTDEPYEETLEVMEITESEYQDFVATFAHNDLEEKENVIETISQNTEDDTKVEVLKEEFQIPVQGDYGMEYAENELIYSQTLKEWITHPALDIIAPEAEPVKAVLGGVVTDIKMDPRFGKMIMITHDNGYQSIYANLSTVDLVYVGQAVETGEIIAGIGKGFGFEASEEPHLHLEILKDGKNVNPAELFLSS